MALFSAEYRDGREVVKPKAIKSRPGIFGLLRSFEMLWMFDFTAYLSPRVWLDVVIALFRLVYLFSTASVKKKKKKSEKQQQQQQ